MIKPPPAGIASDAQKLQRLQRLSLLTSEVDESEPAAADTAGQEERGQGRGPAALLAKVAVLPVESDPLQTTTPLPASAGVGSASPTQQGRAAALFPDGPQVGAATGTPGAPPLTVALREPLNSINLVLPPAVFDAIERAAISRRWTKKCLVLAALQRFGVDIPDSALIPDGRKIRGRRLTAS